MNISNSIGSRISTFALLTALGLFAISCAAPKKEAAPEPAAKETPKPAPAAAAPAVAAPPATVAPPQAPAASIKIAGELIVGLDARDPSAGTATWVNRGSMGDFERIGSPKLSAAGGQPAVQFNGTSDAYRSQKPTPDTITGGHARSIEVWVFNPTLDSTEECMVAWGHRGMTLNNLAFSYGSGGGFSAVTHYDEDMSWGDEVPAAGQWHHLVYAYDGKTVKIYDDGAQRGSQEFALTTAAENRMNIAVENSAEGEPLFVSEFEPNWGLSLSGFIAVVRVHSGGLSSDEVKANFDADKARFGAASP
jgi:concanavalin A-like lectin/glucanase superfamily protein